LLEGSVTPTIFLARQLRAADGMPSGMGLMLGGKTGNVTVRGFPDD